MLVCRDESSHHHGMTLSAVSAEPWHTQSVSNVPCPVKRKRERGIRLSLARRDATLAAWTALRANASPVSEAWPHAQGGGRSHASAIPKPTQLGGTSDGPF